MENNVLPIHDEALAVKLSDLKNNLSKEIEQKIMSEK